MSFGVDLTILSPAVEEHDDKADDDDHRRGPAAKGGPVELEQGIGIPALVDNAVVVGLPLFCGLFRLGTISSHGEVRLGGCGGVELEAAQVDERGVVAEHGAAVAEVAGAEVECKCRGTLPTTVAREVLQ